MLQAAAAAAKKRDEDVKRQHAAIAAQREVERLRLEEQRKKIEAVSGRELPHLLDIFHSGPHC